MEEDIDLAFFCGVYGEAVLSFPGGKLKELETVLLNMFCLNLKVDENNR